MELYRPLGMEWFEQGYWAINNLEDTARQFLDLGSQPVDNTPALNEFEQGIGAADRFRIYDPGHKTTHKACMLDFFKNNKFDYVIASIPAHVDLFKKLIAQFQPEAKLIVQLGNNWSIDQYKNENLLASIAPQPTQANAVFYHQEFDLNVFSPVVDLPTRKIYSFVNLITETGIGWEDYKQLQRLLPSFEFKAYGGQCPNGNMTGPDELAEKMAEAQFVFHVKPGGDGFGHIIHNAYARGRVVITRPSHYRGQLAEQLLVPGTFIDLDRYSAPEIKNIITRLTYAPDMLLEMGDRAYERFKQVVNYDNEAQEISKWLRHLN